MHCSPQKSRAVFASFSQQDEGTEDDTLFSRSFAKASTMRQLGELFDISMTRLSFQKVTGRYVGLEVKAQTFTLTV